MKILLLFTSCFLHVSADTHTLQYLYTTVRPTHSGFPEFTAVGLLNGEQFMSYNSSNRLLIPKDWIKKNDREDFWRSETHEMQGNQDTFTSIFTAVMKQFNHSTGVHTLQRTYGCELHDAGTTREYDKYGYDGEDFISLNMKTGTWTVAKPQALITKQKWESTGYNKHQKNYLKYECVQLLKKFVSYSKETLKRIVRPEVPLFQKHSSSPEVVCQATGFFPKAVNITWQKDGEDVHEDVELRETLPNQDGSFQKRSILKVPAEELQKHTYTCVIQHSSLEKELVLEVPKSGGSDGAPIAILIAVVAALVVVAGIVVRNSMSSSEEDSSSDGSSDSATPCLHAEPHKT